MSADIHYTLFTQNVIVIIIMTLYIVHQPTKKQHIQWESTLSEIRFQWQSIIFIYHYLYEYVYMLIGLCVSVPPSKKLSRVFLYALYLNCLAIDFVHIDKAAPTTHTHTSKNTHSHIKTHITNTIQDWIHGY